MGPVKAALEAACRYLAYELGPQGIRVHAISPGPLKTRAASGLKDFELLLNEAAQKAPLGELVDIMDVGFACAYLATSLAKRITGGTVYVDGGAKSSPERAIGLTREDLSSPRFSLSLRAKRSNLGPIGDYVPDCHVAALLAMTGQPELSAIHQIAVRLRHRDIATPLLRALYLPRRSGR